MKRDSVIVLVVKSVPFVGLMLVATGASLVFQGFFGSLELIGKVIDHAIPQRTRG